MSVRGVSLIYLYCDLVKREGRMQRMQRKDALIAHLPDYLYLGPLQ